MFYNNRQQIHLLFLNINNIFLLQRYEVTELKKYLPEKLDYVVFIKLHPIQINLYKKYIDFLAHQQGKLFLHYRALQCICTHPYVLHLSDKSVSDIIIYYFFYSWLIQCFRILNEIKHKKLSASKKKVALCERIFSDN